MQSFKLRFENAAGELLSARLDLPIDDQPAAYALFAHCFTCSKNLKAIGNIAEELTRRGIAVFRFDFTGLGESTGEFAATNFTSNVEDLIAAARYMEHQGHAPAILIGHSLGGAAMLQAAAAIPSATAVVTIGAPSEPTHVLRLLADGADQVRASGEARVNLSGRTFNIRRQFLDDLEAQTMQEHIRSLRKALLVLHSPVDETVGIENAARIFDAAVHPKSFVSLDHADHLLTRDEDSCYAGTIIGAWASRYVPALARPPIQTQATDYRVVVRNDAGSLRADVMAGRHGFVVDEPVSAGGTNCGPTPYDLLAASLGACTAITLRLYAQRKNWPLDMVAVHLSHHKLHATDCIECADPNAKLDRITREIELNGPLTAEQRVRLMEIAEHCPVHKTLQAGVDVTTTAITSEPQPAAAMQGVPMKESPESSGNGAPDHI